MAALLLDAVHLAGRLALGFVLLREDLALALALALVFRVHDEAVPCFAGKEGFVAVGLAIQTPGRLLPELLLVALASLHRVLGAGAISNLHPRVISLLTWARHTSKNGTWLSHSSHS